MGDPEGPNSKGTPSWQRQEPSNLPKQSDQTPPQEPIEQGPPEPKASLTQKASKFLEADSIHDAPIERKKLFLESKGLTQPEIDALLEIQHTPEAAAMEDHGTEREGVLQPAPPTAPQNPSTSSTPHEAPPATPSIDNPPIITYPEFLLHAQKPAPLITANRLLTSLYVATGAAATVYGTSRYIIEPMIDSLTSARHSLFESARANIDAMNEKLERAVSKVPERAHRFDEDGSDADSTSSDGARFFNRSAGTQTSPRRSRSDSSTSSAPDGALSPTQHHTSALLGVHSKLSDLLRTDGEATSPLGDSMSQLRAYLEKLPYANPVHRGGKAGKDGEMSAVANVKAEIRSVKGVLLSARNFPSGVAVR